MDGDIKVMGKILAAILFIFVFIAIIIGSVKGLSFIYNYNDSVKDKVVGKVVGKMFDDSTKTNLDIMVHVPDKGYFNITVPRAVYDTIKVNAPWEFQR